MARGGRLRLQKGRGGHGRVRYSLAGRLRVGHGMRRVRKGKEKPG